MRGLEEAKDCICKAKKIAICGHVNPDGDSIGSLLSLGLGIEKLGKCVYMLSQDALPQKYMFLPGASRLIKKINNPFDLAITVDCSNKEMVGKTFQILKKARNILEIDHHEFRRPFGQIRLIDHRAAAVGEMVYLFLKELKVRVTKEIAENILTSIIVETNLFRLPGVRPLTFQTCAELIKTGVNFSKLAERIYWSKTKESAILSGICLSRCKFLQKGRIVWSIIRKEDFAQIRGKDYDVDAVANEMRSIEGVEIVILFREKNKKLLRVSLRSKGEINIASVAERYNGGGHFDMAGCYIPNSKKKIRELLSLTEGILR